MLSKEDLLVMSYNRSKAGGRKTVEELRVSAEVLWSGEWTEDTGTYLEHLGNKHGSHCGSAPVLQCPRSRKRERWKETGLAAD